jgi:hypothetical protein
MPAYSYVYFAFKGEDFDPAEITRRLRIQPTKEWRKGDKGCYNPQLKFACWEWQTGKEAVFIEELVQEVVARFEGKKKRLLP